MVLSYRHPLLQLLGLDRRMLASNHDVNFRFRLELRFREF